MSDYMKENMKTKGISDSRLMSLWRKAVLAHNHHQCLLCGRSGDSNLQCHHVIARRRKYLRYDYRNGVPLCVSCHQRCHTKTGDRELSRVFRHYDYCLDNENVIIKNYLVNRGMTDTDFMLEKKKELMYVINKENWT